MGAIVGMVLLVIAISASLTYAAAMKIILDYWNQIDQENQTETIERLIDRAVASGAYLEGIGWAHAGIVKLAHTYGYRAHNRDRAAISHTPLSLSDAKAELIEDLVFGPVIASVWKDFNRNKGGGHLIVLSGATDSSLTILDPEKSGADDGIVEIPMQKFDAGWKMRTICILPK
jgi:hypothetical protein